MSQYVPNGARFITCVFGERKNGKIIEKGTLCKIARGEMVRYIAEEQLAGPEQIRSFDRLGYRFAINESSPDTYVFIKEE